MEISSSNSAQIAAFQSTQNQRLQSESTQAQNSVASQASNQNNNQTGNADTTVQISGEARQLQESEQASVSSNAPGNETSVLGSGGSQSEKPR